MSNRSGPHITQLLFGLFLIFMAVLYTWMGKISDHSFGWVERSKDPVGYWFGIMLYCLVGLAFIAYYLYAIHAR